MWIFQDKTFIDPKLLNNSIHVLTFCKETHQLKSIYVLAN